MRRDYATWLEANGCRDGWDSVLNWLAELEAGGMKWQTLRRYAGVLAALYDKTQIADAIAIIEGARRKQATGKAPGSPAMTLEQYRTIIDTCMLGPIQNVPLARLFISLGFCGAFRVSELAALRWGDVVINEEGAVITVRKSKTDQRGETRKVAIPRTEPTRYSAVDALDCIAYANGEKLSSLQYLFRPWGPPGSKEDNARYVPVTKLQLQRWFVAIIKEAGLEGAGLTCHSMRSGFVTEAANAGADDMSIMRQTGHKSHSTMRMYVRRHGADMEHNALRSIF